MSEQAWWGAVAIRVWRDFSIILVAAAVTAGRVRAEEPVVGSPAAAVPTYSVEAPRPEPATPVSADAGSLYRMAEGYEQLGKLARAWKLYAQAAQQALLVGDTETRARAIGKAETLAPRLAKLTLQVGFFDRKPGTFWLDDESLGPGDYGLPMPLDPGTHRLVARRPGYVHWHKAFAVSAGKSYALTVPTLVLERPAPAPPSAAATGGPGAPSTAPVPAPAPTPISPSVRFASQDATTLLRLRSELERLREARDDVSLTFPILMMAGGTGLTVAGGIDVLSRATGGSGVLFSGMTSQGALLGAGALVAGGALAVVGGVVFSSRVQKRRVLDRLIERRLEKLSRFGATAGFGPDSGTLMFYGAF